jgi:glutaredoxin 3
MKAKVEIYSSPWCGYCYRAKQLLEDKGVDFTNIDLDEEPGRRQEMVTRTQGRTTVPQIFINGKWVGGADDLLALDKAGKLDAMLAEAAS